MKSKLASTVVDDIVAHTCLKVKLNANNIFTDDEDDDDEDFQSNLDDNFESSEENDDDDDDFIINDKSIFKEQHYG
ncbi:unnamed protein product [Rotaria sp. Silwood1]|nr:unnamed protein product [Rotaria sp. Silwood1]